jgi:hypothetical protein
MGISSFSSSDWILLLGSNYKREYISDIVEALGAPDGFVIHFRYRKQWVQPLLWDDLPLKGRYSEAGERAKLSKISTLRTLIIFLFCEPDRSWQHAYPIRFAKISECYKTGDDPSDIAHFYLSISNYCVVKSECLLQELTDLNRIDKKYFVARRPALPKQTVESSDDNSESAFHQLIHSLDPLHFAAIEDRTQYFPIFHFVYGFREAMSKEIQKYCNGYKLIEGKEYILETSIRFFSDRHPATGSSIKLLCYEKRFENKQELQMPVTTYYDEFAWRLVPSAVVDNRTTTVTLETNIGLKSNDASCSNISVLNTLMDLPIKIVPDIRVKTVKTVGECSLLVATSTVAYLGFVKTLKPSIALPEWPGYLVALGYLLGVLTNLFLRWRGR